jgi:hypothetical protein
MRSGHANNNIVRRTPPLFAALIFSMASFAQQESAAGFAAVPGTVEGQDIIITLREN